jgi:hypothetical protein
LAFSWFFHQLLTIEMSLATSVGCDNIQDFFEENFPGSKGDH